MKRITIKVGSNVLTRFDGTLDITRMSALTDQIAQLHSRGIEVILVSSGAVASGRSEVHPDMELDSVAARQIFSAVGQAKLMNRYYDLFRSHGIACGQVLTTKSSLELPQHYENQKGCIESLLNCGIIPIVNENDTISITELMFTDNDELSGWMAQMMSCDHPKALLIVAEGFPQALCQRFFTGMAQRRVADIVGKGRRCHDGAHVGNLGIPQIIILFEEHPCCRSQRTADGTGFKAVGQTGADVILLHQRKNLSFVLKSPEGSRKNHPVKVPLKRRTLRRDHPR